MRAFSLAGVLVLVSFTLQVRAQIADYTLVPPDPNAAGKIRVFNFNSDRPFVNPSTGQSDIGQLQYTGHTINSVNIVEFDNCELATDSRICRYRENGAGDFVTRVQLWPGDPVTVSGQRTQLSTFFVANKKRYIVDMEFKLDAGWNINMLNGAGLIWQLKNEVWKDRQSGNPALGLNLYGDQLTMTISYPQMAADAETWPLPQVNWTDKQYVPQNLPTRTVIPGTYHRVQLIFFADDAPNKILDGATTPIGRGFMVALFDGKPWFEYNGPTLQPDSKLPHRFSWGWYQWQGNPEEVRTIYFRNHRVYEWRE